MSRRITTIGISALLLALVSGNVTWAAQPDARTILKRMLEAEGRVIFTAHQVTTLSKEPAVTSEQTVYRNGFKGLRMEYTYPPSLNGEVMADDGRVLAHLVPKEKVLRMRPSRLANLRMRAEQLVQGFGRGLLKVELVGKDKIAGRTAYVVEVGPKLRRQGQTRKFWIDTEKWIKLKTEDISPDGAVASTSYYTKISFVDSIPADKFRLESPPGVRVEHEKLPDSMITIDKARQKAGFRILEPSRLPPGFKAMGATVIPFRGGKLVALRYTDGVTSFSIFQAPGNALDPRFVRRLHEGPIRRAGMYSWRVGNMNLTAVGQLPQDQMRMIASSVK